MLTWQEESLELQAARLEFCYQDPLRSAKEKLWCLARLHSNEYWCKLQKENRRASQRSVDENLLDYQRALVQEERRKNTGKLPPRGFDVMASSSSNVVGVHYRVGKKIGEGSFGVIFEGTNLLNNNQVAIKFVCPPLCKQLSSMLNVRRNQERVMHRN